MESTRGFQIELIRYSIERTTGGKVDRSKQWSLLAFEVSFRHDLIYLVHYTIIFVWYDKDKKQYNKRVNDEPQNVVRTIEE